MQTLLTIGFILLIMGCLLLIASIYLLLQPERAQ